MTTELSDVLYDLKRIERKCKRLDNEWDDFKRLLEDKDVDSEYQHILYYIWENAEVHEQQTMARDDHIIYIDDDEDDNDKDGKTSAADNKKNIVRAKNGRGDELCQQGQQKTVACVEQKVVLSRQKLNNQADVVWRRPDVQARAGDETRPIETNKEQSRVRLEGHSHRKACRVRRSRVEKPRKKVKMAKGVNVKEENEANMSNAIQIYDAHLHQKPDLRNNLVLENPRHHVDQARSSRKDKGKNVIDNYSEPMNNLVNDGNGEVEILDSTLINQGILSPFVPCNRFDRSMLDGEDLGRPTAADEFRKEVIKVLREPNDKQEFRTLLQEIRAGSYLKHHKDLQKKLSNRRYKQEQRLVILRGFFFWLQNLTREGAFQPWKDPECLAVKPQSR